MLNLGFDVGLDVGCSRSCLCSQIDRFWTCRSPKKRVRRFSLAAFLPLQDERKMTSLIFERSPGFLAVLLHLTTNLTNLPFMLPDLLRPLRYSLSPLGSGLMCSSIPLDLQKSAVDPPRRGKTPSLGRTVVR